MDETLMFIDYLLRCLEEVEKVMQERSKEKKTTFQGEKNIKKWKECIKIDEQYLLDI